MACLPTRSRVLYLGDACDAQDRLLSGPALAGTLCDVRLFALFDYHFLLRGRGCGCLALALCDEGLPALFDLALHACRLGLVLVQPPLELACGCNFELLRPISCDFHPKLTSSTQRQNAAAELVRVVVNLLRLSCVTVGG